MEQLFFIWLRSGMCQAGLKDRPPDQANRRVCADLAVAVTQRFDRNRFIVFGVLAAIASGRRSNPACAFCTRDKADYARCNVACAA